MIRLDDADVTALGEGRVLVYDDVLDADEVGVLRASLRALDEAGALTAPGVGREGLARTELRGDRTTWLGDHVEDPVLAALWRRFEALRHALNEAAWLGLQRFAVQVALYPGGGARYVRHKDALRGDPGRSLTAILYANPGWTPADGGVLRAWEPDGIREIAPVAGRLVVFLADVVEHEVTPSHAPRWAVTAWYRGSSAVPWLEDPERIG